MDLRFNATESRIPLMTKEELKSFRERLGLSQEELARDLRVARNTISRWELGNSKIPEFLDLALRSIEIDLKLSQKIQGIFLEAFKEGKWLTEDEITEKLNTSSEFWETSDVLNIVKNEFDRFRRNEKI